MTAVLLTPPVLQFFDNNGDPLAGGLLYSYVAGTAYGTPKATYTDSTAGTPNSNPVVLDSAGRAPIWISGSYGIVLKTSAGVTVWSADNITSFTSGAVSATFSDNSFTIQDDGDVTKQLMFQLSGLGTGVTSVLSVPNKSGTMALLSDLSGIAGESRNARMYVSTASATATFTADEIIVETALGGTVYRLSSYSQSINLGTTGAGGMDTGTAPISGYVSLYAITKADGTKNILACSTATSSGPVYTGGNMPSGYVASGLIGAWPTNGSSQFVVGFIYDRRFEWGTTVAVLTGGTSTSYTSVSLSTAAPSNAKKVHGLLGGGASGSSGICTVAADSTGTAKRVFFPTTNTITAINEGFYGVGCFENLPMITAQTLYYRVLTSNTARIEISGYDF